MYIPPRKQTVLTRAGYIGLQIRSMNKRGRSLSIAGSVKKDSRPSLAGWPRAVILPGLPQTRTCIFDAYGSSGHGLAAR